MFNRGCILQPGGGGPVSWGSDARRRALFAKREIVEPIHAVMPANRMRPARVRVFLDALQAVGDATARG
jgi:hypothetical protein